jgi:hypothetical protein
MENAFILVLQAIILFVLFVFGLVVKQFLPTL